MMRSKRKRWLIFGGAIFILFIFVTLTVLPAMNGSGAMYQPAGVNPIPPSGIHSVTNEMPPTDAASAKNFFADVSVLQATSAEGEPTKNPQVLVSQKRIVIQNASLDLVVQDTAATLTTIIDLTNKIGGWVVTSNSYQSANRVGKQLTYGSATIRVPADQLVSTLQQIKASVVSVTSQKITGSDVTSQYVDLTSHLTNLQAAEDQLRKIMDSATKTEDVLAVYKQLVDVRGQIEQIKGQLNYYDQAAAYSSIDISLMPSDDNQPIVIAGWQPGNTAKTAISTLIQLAQGLADLVIWFVIVVLPFAVLLLILYVLYRRVRRRIALLAVVPLGPTASPPSDSDQTIIG